jgi:hypothetical protein
MSALLAKEPHRQLSFLSRFQKKQEAAETNAAPLKKRGRKQSRKPAWRKIWNLKGG